MNFMKRIPSLLVTLFFVLVFLTSGAQSSSWLTYHLANSVKTDTGDPNCAFFWKGRYHLFIIEENEDGVCYAHFSSKDMLHWEKHPITLSPVTMGHNMFSGTGFFTLKGEPAIIYHGKGSERNQISFAIDDMLEQWTDPVPVEPKTIEGKVPKMRHWDPDCWLIDSTYYAISGGLDPELMKSSDLKNWLYLGKLLPDTIPDIGVKREEDISCPNMFKIGDKWMLLCLSHWLGCRYYLGDFKNEKYVPEFHARMNWMCELNKDADVFAPESVLTPDGRRVMWAWVRVKERLKDVDIQSSIQTLPRELSLPPDGILRIKPLRELENLRINERSESNVKLKSGDNYVLKRISGDAIELAFEISNINAEKYGINVYCDKYGRNGFPIIFQKDSGMFLMDTTKVPFQLEKNEPLKIRVFLDKNIIEVFVNDRQAALAPHKYAKNNINVSVFCDGGSILFDEIIGWDIKSIYTNCE
jgi:beta-fructofuranosidase